QVLLKQLHQYGMVVVDGGNAWAISAEANHWPANYVQAVSDVSLAGPTTTISNTALTGNVVTIQAVGNLLVPGNNVFISGTTLGGVQTCSNGTKVYNDWHVVATANGTNFTYACTHADIASGVDTGTVRQALSNFMEFVDESGIEVNAASGVTTTNREPVTFTRTSDSAVQIVDVALQGVAVNLAQDYLNIMAGTPAQQLTALSNLGGVTWTMSPAVGTLTSAGVYTAPASVASPTTTTITATSTTNAAVSASMLVTVFPGPALRLLPSQTTNFTDSASNVWYGGAGIGTSQPANIGQGGCGNPPVTDHPGRK